jgi:hypothetical protein
MESGIIKFIDFEFLGLNFAFFLLHTQKENRQKKTSEQINYETHCGFKAETLMLTIELAAFLISSLVIPEWFVVSLA